MNKNPDKKMKADSFYSIVKFQVRIATPKRVRLPNGWTFYAKYKRAKRDALPDIVTIRRTYKKRVRKDQRGREIKDILVKVFRLAKK